MTARKRVDARTMDDVLRLKELADKLASARALSRGERHNAARVLYFIVAHPKAIDALFTTRGAPRKDHCVALDYLVQYELKGKSADAAEDVGGAWRISPATVLGHLRRHRAKALADFNLVTERDPDTRRLELQRLSAELRESVTRGRKK
jgi:hypothetical protein